MVFDRPAGGVVCAALPPSDQRGIAMSDLSSSGTEKPGSSKQKVSPLRNAIGLIVLVTVIVVGWLQYSAKSAYNTAATALNERMKEEEKDLMSEQEVDSLLGKSPDGPGSDFRDDFREFTMKTYTWRGVLKSYTVTAFYTKSLQPVLHHYESEGAKLPLEPRPPAPSATTIKGPGSRKAPESTAKTSKPANTKDTGPETAKTPEPTAEASKPSTTPDAVPEIAKTPEPTAEPSKPSATKDAVPDTAPK
jgi:hypothetical protein